MTTDPSSSDPAATPALGWRRPTLAVGAFVAAFALFWATFTSPIGVAFVGGLAKAVDPPAPTVPARNLSADYGTETLRTTDRYQAYAAGLDPGMGSLYVMGSSELGSLAPQNPANFLRGHIADRDLFLSGRGYVQSLPHALELAAVAPELRHKQVALIVSPQWFVAGGITPEAFKEVFSASYYRATMASPELSEATKERVAQRVGGLLGAPWGTVAQDPSLGARLAAPAVAAQDRAGQVIAALAETDKAVPLLPQVGLAQPATGEVPYADFDWDAAAQQAATQGAAAITNNPFGIEDGYYTKYIAPQGDALRGSMSGLDYAQPTPEYEDLDLFLTIADEVGVEVLLISVPMNAAWYDYGGYPKERRDLYCDKIRGIAADHGATLADFSANESTDYFLYDVMHLGWRGWLDVTHACLEFERTP